MNLLAIASFTISVILGLLTLLFIFRIVLTWYPQIELTRFPWNVVYLPTEPFLVPTRKIITPLGGVDITPIVWVGLVTLIREILLGQQGLLTMAMYK